jgi:hypothetical protein
MRIALPQYGEGETGCSRFRSSTAAPYAAWSWKAANADLQDRKLVLDLKNVTQISEEGEDALSELMREGATFSCNGVLTKHVLQQLARKSKKGA